jgi:hypothetical protein
VVSGVLVAARGVGGGRRKQEQAGDGTDGDQFEAHIVLHPPSMAKSMPMRSREFGRIS